MSSQDDTKRSPRSAATINKVVYFITICRHQVKTYVEKSDIESIITKMKWIEPTLDIKDSAYEISPTYTQLHYHALVTTRAAFRYSKLTTLDGFRIYWKKVTGIKDIRRILTYIHKDSCNKEEQEQVLNCNYYYNHYAFNK